MNGCLITFEGVEGCGKSTQIERLREYLAEERGVSVVVTREPGGTVIAEAIRGVLLDPAHAKMGAVTELLLYEAARAQHFQDCIAPALVAEQVVLCDRFTDSTVAYQGGGRGLDGEMVMQLNSIAAQGVVPDCTFLLDVPVSVGMERVRGRGTPDRIEQESLDFHEKLRQSFLALAHEAPERIITIDGTMDVDLIASCIRDKMETLL